MDIFTNTKELTDRAVEFVMKNIKDIVINDNFFKKHAE